MRAEVSGILNAEVSGASNLIRVRARARARVRARVRVRVRIRVRVRNPRLRLLRVAAVEDHVPRLGRHPRLQRCQELDDKGGLRPRTPDADHEAADRLVVYPLHTSGRVRVDALDAPPVRPVARQHRLVP